MQLVLQRGVRCNVTHFDSDAGEREGEGGMLLGVSLPAAAPPPMLQCYDAPMLRFYTATMLLLRSTLLRCTAETVLQWIAMERTYIDFVACLQ